MVHKSAKVRVTSAMASPVPVDIHADGPAGELRIQWSDGHESRHPFEFMRLNCPCAGCQGEGSFPGTLSLNMALRPDQYDLVDLKMVGNYALEPTWRDGHSTGLFSFEKLRRECQCEQCQPHRAH
jgi:DUF971 family protein